MSKIKIAIVTGASSGIGLAISKMLLDNDFEVYGIGRDFKKNIESEIFHQIVCDVTDTNLLSKTVKEINKDHNVSLLVNCAGVGYYGLHEELNPQKIQALVRTNLEAPMILCNLLLRDLKQNKGTIINVSSVTAMELNPHGCAYGATKAGLTSFSHSLFEEQRKYGLKVVNIMPDMTATNLYRNANFTYSNDDYAYLSPEQVADAVKYVLDAPETLVLTDLTLKPQFHKISKK